MKRRSSTTSSSIPPSWRAKVTVTDQDQRDYYEKNKAKYNVPEKRQAKYIFLDTLETALRR